MEKNKKLIWAYLSMKKGTYDNDYYFYEDGTIFHHYDRTITKLGIEENVLPSDISDFEKEKIISKWEKEVTDKNVVEKIKNILT